MYKHFWKIWFYLKLNFCRPSDPTVPKRSVCTSAPKTCTWLFVEALLLIILWWKTSIWVFVCHNLITSEAEHLLMIMEHGWPGFFHCSEVHLQRFLLDTPKQRCHARNWRYVEFMWEVGGCRYEFGALTHRWRWRHWKGYEWKRSEDPALGRSEESSKWD